MQFIPVIEINLLLLCCHLEVIDWLLPSSGVTLTKQVMAVSTATTDWTLL